MRVSFFSFHGAVTAFAVPGTGKTRFMNSIPQRGKKSRAAQPFPFLYWGWTALQGLEQGQ